MQTEKSRSPKVSIRCEDRVRGKDIFSWSTSAYRAKHSTHANSL